MNPQSLNERVLPDHSVVGNARARVFASDRKKSWTLLSFGFIGLNFRRLGC
jgi:hypothetical protein